MSLATNENRSAPGTIWKREKFMILTWQVLGQCLEHLKRQIEEQNVRPSAIVAISRGGLVLGTYLGNAFGIRDLQIISIIRNTSDEKRSDRGAPQLRWMAPDASLQGHTVLLVDDITGDGGTLRFACQHLAERQPQRLLTAVIVKNENTRFLPDFHAVEVGEWTVFPWERPLDGAERTELIRL
jgi:hypoxanthine phosphoribosyltransferase